MTAPISFRTSVQTKAGADEAIEITITDDHDKPDEPDQFTVYKFYGTRPTSGQILLITSADFDDPERARQSVQLLFDFLEGVFGEDGRRQLERLLARNKIDMGTITDMISSLLAAWSAFPTQPSSDSSDTPVPTGTRSTGRQRRPALTPSISPSIDSSTTSTTGA
jgi:hypothetical protein